MRVLLVEDDELIGYGVEAGCVKPASPSTGHATATRPTWPSLPPTMRS